MTARLWLTTTSLSACFVALLAVAVGEISPRKTSEDERLRAERLAARLNLPLSVTNSEHPVGDIRTALEGVDADPKNISSQITFFRGNEQPTTLTQAVVDLTVNHRTSQISHEVFGDLIYSNHCEFVNEVVASRVVARKADEARGPGWDVELEGLDELGRAQCLELYRLGILTSKEVLTRI